MAKLKKLSCELNELFCVHIFHHFHYLSIQVGLTLFAHQEINLLIARTEPIIDAAILIWLAHLFVAQEIIILSNGQFLISMLLIYLKVSFFLFRSESIKNK